MLRAGVELARHAVGLLYPSSCLVCDSPDREGFPVRHGLCTECRRAVVTDPYPTCPRCAQTVGPHSDTADGCGECRASGFPFDAAVRLGPYAGKLRDAVLRMKLLSGEGLADRLGQLLAHERATALRALGVEVVVPVPLHWWRRWTRGYNQSESLAREIARSLALEFGNRALRRVKFVTQHAQPTRAARLASMEGAFRAGRGARLTGRTVLLVDDVMTTGGTASAAARALRKAGAARVVLAVAARR